MKFIKFVILLLNALFLSHQVFALKVDTKSIKNNDMFEIQFDNGTSYCGKSSAVISISKQQFVVTPLYVTEIAIELLGTNSQLRIYNARTISVDDIENLAANKIPEHLRAYAKIPDTVKTQISVVEDKLSNANAQQLVYKVYPTTTHSKTLEFVVDSIEELEALYNRLRVDFLKVEADENTTTSDGKEIIGMGKKTYIVESKNTTNASN